jgi:hydroxylaminobenzene mutase
MNMELKHRLGRRLLRAGMILFTLGLLTGFAIPLLKHPRLGLSSHLEGVQNGMVLVLLGLLWPKLRLGAGWLKAGFYLALYGTFANWGTTFLAAAWAAGGEMMPLAGGGAVGTAWQEGLVKFGLFSLALAMMVVSGIVLSGLRGKADPAVEG